MLRLPQDLHDRIIVLRIMWEGAVRAILDPSAVFLKIPGIPRAVLHAVHGAVTEQAVKVFCIFDLVARKILTFFVLKKFIMFTHICFLLMYLIKSFKISNIFH